MAARRFILANGDDGLAQPWTGRFVFVNPPFSKQLVWLRRARERWKAGGARTIVCLVPVRTDSVFFHQTLRMEADLYLLQSRLPFIDTRGKAQATPFSLMLVVFGATTRQKRTFAELVPVCWVTAGVALTGRARSGTAAQRGKVARGDRQIPRYRSGEILFVSCAARGGDYRVLCNRGT